MTVTASRARLLPPTFAERVAAERERADAGHADPCDSACACHGDIRCVREQHPHGPDDTVPHAGYDADGQIVQWVHHGPVLSAAEVADQAATARRDHTAGLLAGLDLDTFATALAGPLAAALAQHRNGSTA